MDPTRISTRASVKELQRITQSIFKILIKGFYGRICAGSPQDLPRRTCTSHARTPRDTFRSSNESLCQMIQRQHFNRISTRSSHLYEITQGPLRMISLGSPQDLLRGTWARDKRGFHPDLHKIFAQGAVQDHARTS